VLPTNQYVTIQNIQWWWHINHGTGSIQKVPKKVHANCVQNALSAKWVSSALWRADGIYAKCNVAFFMEDNLDRRLEFCEWATNMTEIQTSHLWSCLQRKPIFLLMERLIVKTYTTGVMPTRIRWAS
jgi:hypothetical protein